MHVSYSAYAAWVERHHRLILGASVLLSLLAALSLTRLRLDMDVLNMLPEGEAAFDDFKTFVVDFGQLDELLVLIEGAPGNELREFADAFAERLQRLPTVAAVHARIDVDEIRDGLLGDFLPNYLTRADYEELAARLTPEGIDRQVEALRAVLAAPLDLSAARAVVEDPLGMQRLAARHLAEASGTLAAGSSSGYFSSPDGDSLLVFVRPHGSGFDVAFSERLLNEVHAAERETRRNLGRDGVRVAYTGSYVYALEDAATLRADVLRYVLLALLAVLAVFLLGYGNLRILPFVTYPLLSTTLLTFGLSLLFFAQLNAVSISFAAILYGLSIDSGIHFYSRLVEERRREPADLRAAVTATLVGLGRAHLTSSITTAAAFLVLGLSCLGAVRQLGLLTALGMMLTTLHFFILYPALAFWRAPPIERGLISRQGRVLEATARWATRHARAVTLGAALVAAALLLVAFRVRLDASLMDLRPKDSPAAAVQAEVLAKFGARHGEGAVLVRRETIESALLETEEITRRLGTYEGEGMVRSIRTVSAILPSVEEQRARLERYNALPRAAAIDSLRTALGRHGFAVERFEPFFSRFRAPRHDVARPGDPVFAPLSPLLEHHVRLLEGGTIVATYLEPAPGTDWRTIAERLRHDLPGPGVAVAARALLERELARVLGDELALFLALGILGNLVLLRVSLGGLAPALAALAPVLLVLIAVFAVMGATGTALDPVNLIVAPLILGIGVDDGVYILSAARQEAGVPAAFRSAGRAIVITSLTTMAGFGFLGLSRYPALAAMGMLVALGVFLCLLASTILLPALPASRHETRSAEVKRAAP